MPESADRLAMFIPLAKADGAQATSATPGPKRKLTKHTSSRHSGRNRSAPALEPATADPVSESAPESPART